MTNAFTLLFLAYWAVIVLSAPPNEKPLGNVLVIGGCGFVGYHIVRELIEQDLCTDLAVLSRTPNQNRVDGVSYHAGDIANLETVKTVFENTQPRVIFNTAAPKDVLKKGQKALHKATIINGTQNTLACSAEQPSVQAYIYTSSTIILEGEELVNANETHQILTDKSKKASDYAKAKAQADSLVLQANGQPNAANTKTLSTACIRPVGVYGERGAESLAGLIGSVQAGTTNIQLGNNKNLMDWVSAQNVALAHVLAAQALVSETGTSSVPKVDGEAFIVTDGVPMPFWDFARKVFTAAGDTTSPDKVRVVPAGVAMRMASVVEWAYWLATCGRKEPGSCTRQKLRYACLTNTYCIDKARERLGYVPRVDDRDAEIDKAVKWALDELVSEKVEPMSGAT